MAEFDPSKLKIQLTKRSAGYESSGTNITVTLFYDEQWIDEDRVYIQEGKREYPYG